MSEQREWVRTILTKAQDQVNSKITICEGYISDVRNSGFAKVNVLPEDIQTNWLPILTLGSDQSFVRMGFEVNDDVVVLFFGSYDNGIIVGGFSTEEDGPITDFLVRHRSGAKIRVSDSGIDITSNGTVNVEGSTVNVDGNFVNLAGGGAGVARLGDIVQTAFGPAPITSASLRVKAG